MIEGVLLTGGASRRMGRDKASIVLDGETLAERSARVLLEVCERVTVLGPAPILGLPFLPDREAHGGPLMALAEFEPSGDYVVILACDMPNVNAETLRFLVHNLGGADACVPLAEGRLQPTCAVYRADALATIRSLCADGSRSLMAWLDTLRVVDVPVDPTIVRNVNFPSDLGDKESS
jgi:molybdopterin-guanine dinucleotide biosynthesis protein A